MKLYIAEKPSLGRAIVDALPKPHHKSDGCVYVGHADKSQCDVVSWCIGHLLEQAEPEQYDTALKKWAFSSLPMLPEQLAGEWLLKPKTKTRKQVTILRKLAKDADQIVHCGDPDREGQLLVDELLHFFKLPKFKLDTVERCLISDLNLPAVKRALSKLKSNQAYKPLSVSALARSRADWLYGMNLTRAFTLQAKASGYSGLISVGRVQTPVLGLVVRRDDAIEHFVPHDYFQVDATISVDAQQTSEHFKARWQPSEACENYTDSEGRIVNKALAENVARRVTGQPAQVEAFSKKEKKQAAPLPYNLSSLQIDAAKRFGMNAKVVLDVCQSLYEQHKLITYPRSDCRYLPEEHFAQAPAVIESIASSGIDPLGQFSANADRTLKSRAWNDKKVGAHHAIIPTALTSQNGNKGSSTLLAKFARLSAAEKQIYELIARQYLMQFYPAWRYQDVQVNLRIEGGLFIAKSRMTLDLGWKTLSAFSRDHSNSDEAQKQSIPDLKVGDSLLCTFAEVLTKQTEAPKAFTDASLLAAMTGIARFVQDADLKKILKETDGLGTEATRAGIIELLFKRQYLQRKGKAIHATQLGKVLVNNLPEALTLPDMTALWERQLESMSEQRLRYEEFMTPLTQSITESIGIASKHPVKDANSLQALPDNRKKKVFKKRRFTKKAGSKQGKKTKLTT